MKAIFFIILTFFFSVLSITIGKAQLSVDTIQYLAGSNWDNYLKWNISQQSGSIVTKGSFDGINGNGIKINCSFSQQGGWLDMNMALQDTLTKKYPFVF